MAKRSRKDPVRQSQLLPQFGRIIGGKLDGWSYAFLNLEVWAIQGSDWACEMYVRMRVAAPWSPFPTVVLMTFDQFKELQPEQDSKPKYLDMQTLSDNAVTSWNTRKATP